MQFVEIKLTVQILTFLIHSHFHIHQTYIMYLMIIINDIKLYNSSRTVIKTITINKILVERLLQHALVSRTKKGKLAF